MKYFLLYLLVINVYGIFLMFLDKYKAKHNKWRIPEKKLFITAIIGGSFGIFFGMYLFRHKTQHKKFVYGIPVIIIFQLCIFYYVIKHIYH